MKTVIGDATLYLGDCTELDIEYDAIVTDPPYDTQAERKFYDKCSGNVIVFCKPEMQPFLADEYLFWTKTPSTKNFVNKCGRFVEMILVLRRGKTFNCIHWSQMIGWFDDRHIVKPIHPWEKPLTLMQRLIRIYTKEGDTVYDPFMGSGTTGIAALSLGRKFVGCDNDPTYYNLAVSRFENSL